MDISNKDMPKAGDRNRRKVGYLHIKRKVGEWYCVCCWGRRSK